MATRRNPRFKECRRLGVNVCGHPKAMNRANDPAFKKSKKTSEYGKQLCEKQKVKAYYGILERQLRRYYDIASRKEGKTGENLIVGLETRLDNLVYRIGFANSIRMARQVVSHGHVRVDGKKINIPSFQVKPGQVVTLCEKAQKNEQFKTNFLNGNRRPLAYIEVSEEAFSGKLIMMPKREEIPVEINEQLVVEFYSK
ncbi:MAG: 30S ribosomal protein S4 [Spirochaetales bacterium]|nr:30S ribosomal protein S4 [Spirochaetales bacterium]